ncbi:hypothetical protein BOX15_Mlig014935g1, partial [Macrostomum lignano]
DYSLLFVITFKQKSMESETVSSQRKQQNFLAEKENSAPSASVADAVKDKVHRAVPVVTVSDADDQPEAGSSSLYSLIRKRKQEQPEAKTPNKFASSSKPDRVIKVNENKEQKQEEKTAEDADAPPAGGLVAAMRQKLLAAQAQSCSISAVAKVHRSEQKKDDAGLAEQIPIVEENFIDFDSIEPTEESEAAEKVKNDEEPDIIKPTEESEAAEKVKNDEEPDLTEPIEESNAEKVKNDEEPGVTEPIEEESEAADKVENDEEPDVTEPIEEESEAAEKVDNEPMDAIAAATEAGETAASTTKSQEADLEVVGDVVVEDRQRSDSCGSFDRMLMTEMPNVFYAGGANCQVEKSPAVLPPLRPMEAGSVETRTPENRAIRALKREDISSFQQQQQQQQPTPQHDFRSPCKQTVSPSRTPPITIEQYRQSQQALLTQWESAPTGAPTSPTSQLADEGVALTGDLKERLDRLEQLVMLEESVLRQASKARPLCTTASQSVETCRILLLAGERRRHYLAEAARLKEQLRQLESAEDAVSIASSASSSTAAAASAHAIGASFELLATLTVSGLRLSLTQLPLMPHHWRHHFACLLLCPEGRVIATELVSATLPDAVSSSKPVMLEIPNCVSVNQLKYNFQIMLSIYWMPALDDPASSSGSGSLLSAASPAAGSAVSHVKRRRLLNFSFNSGAVSRSPSIKSALTGGKNSASAGASATAASMLASLEQAEAAGFQLVGETCLQLRDIVGATAEADAAAASLLTLRRPSTTSSSASTAACPLATQLAARCQIRVTPSPRASLSGYVSWHRVVGDLAAWARLWTVLTPERLRAWSQPEDSEQGLPCLQSVDLTRCPSNQIVGIAPEEVCVRRHTLSLRLAGSASQTDNLLLLNCESRDQRLVWCAALNAAMQQLRNWGLGLGSEPAVERD